MFCGGQITTNRFWADRPGVWSLFRNPSMSKKESAEDLYKKAKACSESLYDSSVMYSGLVQVPAKTLFHSPEWEKACWCISRCTVRLSAQRRASDIPLLPVVRAFQKAGE